MRFSAVLGDAVQHHTGGAGTAAGDGDAVTFAVRTAVVLAWSGLVAGYLVADRVAVLRGRTSWPAVRTASWLSGALLGLVVSVGPVASAAGNSFTAHMAVHLVLGMLVPLLLVLGAPMTLVLRAVPVHAGRRLAGLAGSPPLRILTHPVTALVLSIMPMALLYRDGSALALLHDPVAGPVLHVHFVASGALFAYAVVGVDPQPHRASVTLRAGAILVSIAAHGMIAKHLYSLAGAAGMPDGTAGAAQLMYYGGDAVHALLLVVFCLQVYRRTGRAGRRAGASLSGSASGRVV